MPGMMLKRLAFLPLMLGLLLAPLPARTAWADTGILQVRIDLSEQRMRVYLGSRQLYIWPISSARAGKVTPLGTYHPQYLSANHRSSLYNDAPMPWSVFFSGHYAIHGTTEVSKLGQPASAGCIRLHPDHAHLLFDLVKARPFQDSFVVIRP